MSKNYAILYEGVGKLKGIYKILANSQSNIRLESKPGRQYSPTNKSTLNTGRYPRFKKNSQGPGARNTTNKKTRRNPGEYENGTELTPDQTCMTKNKGSTRT